MAQIYISYRREDSGYFLPILRGYLQSGNVIVSDIDNITFSKNLDDLIKENLAICDVMLVIIGPNWLEAKNDLGERRITAANDIVRIEIATALSLGKRVIPVLWGETALPQITDLPGDLSELASKLPVRINAQSLEQGVNHLIGIINETVDSGSLQLSDNRKTVDPGSSQLPENMKKGVFISYSHQDETWKDLLVTQLSVLEAENLLHVWDDRKIQVGDNWKQNISDAMRSASIAILLVSADFLTSKFIRSEEVPKILARQKQDGLRVVPIIIRPCAWKLVSWLAEIQVRPKDGRALSSGNSNQIDQDLTDLVTEIALFIA
jgi:hypothetical protein